MTSPLVNKEQNSDVLLLIWSTGWGSRLLAAACHYPKLLQANISLPISVSLCVSLPFK